MLFKEVIGQHEICKELRASVLSNRISHAQLFHGPEGCGLLSLALAYAQYINCTNKQEDDSCGVCSSCVKYNKLQHPDLHLVFPVAPNTKIKKDPVSDHFIKEWREIVLQHPYLSLDSWLAHIGVENKQGSIYKQESSEIYKKLNLKTYESEYKVMIIWMAEKMNEICANKILKILEEPPEKTLFLLLAENTESMLQTILSRTQIRRVPKIDKESIRQKITADFDFNETDVNAIVHNSNGNYHKAFQLASFDNSHNEFFNFFTQLMRLAYSKNLPELAKVTDEIGSIGREKQKAFIEYSLGMIRENFILHNKLEDIVYLYQQEKEFSSKFNAFINQKNIASLTKEFNEAYHHIERNGNAKLIFFDVALKLIILLRA